MTTDAIVARAICDALKGEPATAHAFEWHTSLETEMLRAAKAAITALLAMREPSSQVTDAMLCAGGSAVLKTAHLGGCARAKAIWLTMNAAREPSPQGAPERGAEGVLRDALIEARGHIEGMQGLIRAMSGRNSIAGETAVEKIDATLTRQPVSPKSDVEAMRGALEPFASLADEMDRIAKANGAAPGAIIRKAPYEACNAARKALAMREPSPQVTDAEVSEGLNRIMAFTNVLLHEDDVRDILRPIFAMRYRPPPTTEIKP